MQPAEHSRRVVRIHCRHTRLTEAAAEHRTVRKDRPELLPVARSQCGCNN